MLDGCKREREEGREVLEDGGEDEIVEQAVDFLQALLDLMMDLHLHLEVREKPRTQSKHNTATTLGPVDQTGYCTTSF